MWMLVRLMLFYRSLKLFPFFKICFSFFSVFLFASLVPLVLQPAKGACLPFVGLQDWGALSMALTTHSPERVSTCVISHFLWVPSHGHRSQPNHFSSLPCVSFLQPWWYRSPSASFQLVFHENCSTCRCIFWCVHGGKWAPCPLSLPSWLISTMCI